MTTKRLAVQIYSDIHIELWNKLPELPVNSKYLFLAGDICRLTHPLFYPFFDYCSSKWEKVFYTPGNHEFYEKGKIIMKCVLNINISLTRDIKMYFI
jgi:hypothetical protein